MTIPSTPNSMLNLDDSMQSFGTFAAFEGGVEEVTALRLQNRLLEGHLQELTHTMKRSVEEKYDELQRKVCRVPVLCGCFFYWWLCI